MTVAPLLIVALLAVAIAVLTGRRLRSCRRAQEACWHVDSAPYWGAEDWTSAVHCRTCGPAHIGDAEI